MSLLGIGILHTNFDNFPILREVLNHPEMQRKVEKIRYPPQGGWDLEYFQNQASEGGFSANFLSIFTFSGGKKTFLAKSIKHNLGNIFGSGYISIPRGGGFP